MSAGITIDGLKELQRNLATLGERTQRKVLRSATSAAATPVVKAARSNAPKESGLLKKSLGKKIATNKKTQSVTAVIGPRKGVSGEYKGKLRKPSRYAHLSHGPHISPSGEYVPGKPWLNDALTETEGQALNVLGTKLGEGIQREAAKGS